MATQVRRNGAWVDNTGEKKRVNGAWVSNEPYKVMKPYISGIPPFTFKSDGENLRDWSITGQTGGVGNVTDNRIDADTVYSAYKQADGTFQGTVNNFYTTHPKPFTADDIGKTFTFAIKVNLISSNNIRASANVGGANINGNNISSPAITKVTFTVASVNDYLYVGYGSGGGNQINISDIMLNEGSTALPFEPYGYKIPITCGGQTTNIYLGSATSTRRIKKLVLTGSENWTSFEQSGITLYRCANSLTDKLVESPVDTMICNCLQAVSSRGDCATTSNSISVYNVKSDSRPVVNVNPMTLSEWTTFIQQQYAAGTPVTIWYVLATEETGIVNEPLMKIGSYADEITKTGTGVNIPTVNGSNTLTVGTTVQPSEMTIESISQWV